MNLFDHLVNEALKNQPLLSALRNVVEKELLHHDILQIMRDHHLLHNLTFMGGTCLRACYGGVRLSEDLDFTGGADFTKEQLSSVGQVLTQSLQKKYGLKLSVTEPIKETGNTATWKIKIETRPEAKDLPLQRINIDVCALPSYEKCPMMLQNPYGIDLGTSALILQAESREEIYADKLIAFALRPGRIKHRDLWDIAWLHSQGITPRLQLIPRKLEDRKVSFPTFLKTFNNRLSSLKEDPQVAQEFTKEMNRFLPQTVLPKKEAQKDFWVFMIHLLAEQASRLEMTAC